MALCLLMGCQTSINKVAEPNFLFIVVDDLGHYDLSCLGSEYYETPNIDRLAYSGIFFTRGYSTSAVCSPSRASLLTGKFTARHGITDFLGARTGTAWRRLKRHNKLLPPDYVKQLPQEYITLPEAMREQGYHTFFAGKWHLGGKGSYPEDHGFDVNKGGYEAGGPYSGGYFSPFDNPFLDDRDDERGISLSMKLAKETSIFIENNRDSKFLAYLSFYAVHDPIQTPQAKWEKYRRKADSIGICESGFEMERRLPIRIHQDNPVYAGLVEQVDDAVGYVLSTLEKFNLDRNTVIIFTSDNGGLSSDRNTCPTSLRPLRGGKGYQWEGGIRVPYFIYVPWMNHAGSRNKTPVTGADLYPTILELADLNLLPQEHADGVSLLPILTGGKIPQRSLFWHYPHYGNQGGDPSSMIMEGEWKLIHYWEDGKNELYNLSNDLDEKNDVAIQNPKIADRMGRKLKKWLVSLDAKYPIPDPQFNIDSLNVKLDSYKTEILQKLEEKRLQELNPDWQPNDDWWGSKLTKE